MKEGSLNAYSMNSPPTENETHLLNNKYPFMEPKDPSITSVNRIQKHNYHHAIWTQCIKVFLLSEK